MVTIPKDRVIIGENICAYIAEFKGKKYLHLCKFYIKDNEYGRKAGGLVIDPDDFFAIMGFEDEITELIKRNT
jgi:hypothetical protein